MKANELMIGDRVRKLERGGHSIPVKIIAIYEYNADYETRDGNVGCMSIHGYEPIPLTAEILEDNGFRKHDFEHIEGQHKWSWWRDTGTLVSLWCRELADDPGEGWMVRIESPDATCCRKVESVHELQHALRLCGIEKEIEL